jgi:hypothetical protein
LPSHKIKLSDKGFKTLSTDFIIDIFALLILFSLVIFSLFQHSKIIFVFSLYALISIGVYIYYRARNGYLYPLGFFYQILLFWAITPPVFLNWYTVPLIGFILFGLYYKKNIVQSIYFPMSLYLSLLVTTIVFVFGKTYLYKELFAQDSTSLYYFLDHTNISGYFFRTNQSIIGSFHSDSFSIIEKIGYFSPLLVLTLSFRQKNVLLDFLLLLGMGGLIFHYFGENLEYLKNRSIALLSLWYLIFSAPGRNKGFSLNYSIISLVFTGAITLLLIKGSFGFPPIMIPVTFFIVQSILYLLTQDPGPHNFNIFKRPKLK